MKWDEMRWDGQAGHEGRVSSKDTYGKPYNSWRLWGEKIV